MITRRLAGGLLRARRSHRSTRSFTVLGIETSCDDTCAAIVDTRARRVLAAERLAFPRSQAALHGISPRVAAENHRANVDRLVDDCVRRAGVRLADLDAIAATTTPGLVIALKVGADKALALCRDYRRPFLAVHHMRAHALVVRMCEPEVRFPFVALLISGAHSIVCVVRSAVGFVLLGESTNISPGGAIDKVAREAGIRADVHYGAAVEELAKQSTSADPLRYVSRVPHVDGADFDFLAIKHTFTAVLERRADVNVADLCRNLQLIVAGHLCQRLDVALRYALQTDDFRTSNGRRSLVVAGGVAANAFIGGAIRKLAAHHDFDAHFPPRRLVTDNAEMIAWTGGEMLAEDPHCAIPFARLPPSVYVDARTPIGRSQQAEVRRFAEQTAADRPRLRISSLMPDDSRPLFRPPFVEHEE